MKKLVFLVAFLAAIFVPECVSARENSPLLAQSSNEAKEYNYILDEWDLGDYQEFVRNYPKSRYLPEIKARIDEIELWNDAKSKNTSASYMNYLKNSKYGHFRDEALKGRDNAEQRLIDRDWDNALMMNSITAIQDFLEKYPNSTHTDEANAKIIDLQSLEAWEGLKNSTDVYELNAFITQYPRSSVIEEAKSRLHAIKGADLYEAGDLNGAATEFAQVTVMEMMPESARTAYSSVKEYSDFKKLTRNSSIYDLNNFISKYPNSEYNIEVRNFIALQKAAALTTSSTERDYSEALSYATGATQQQVKNYIKKVEDEKSYIRSQYRKAQRNENGGWMGLVFEYGDLSWNGRIDDGVFKYEFGFKFRVGNYADRVQAAVGIKPGVAVWDFAGIYNDKEDDSDKSSAFFIMPIEAELKVNLCKTGESSWLYLDGRYDYNAVGDKKVMRPMGFAAGLGFGGKAWDILFYYGMEFGSIPSKYSRINGYANPFMESRTASFFGVSFAAVIKLF